MDDEVIHNLTCDVELSLAGPTAATVDKRTADVLRKLADRIEKNEIEDGHHQVEDSTGKPAGTVYVDCSVESRVMPGDTDGQVH
tara:strand:+ start:202218 stop:202469 length:252 start_codon:yes stop_codon:yes gene_type:complete